MDESEEAEDRELIAKTGAFGVQLTSPRVRWSYREEGRLAAHKRVLQPLLKAATECWAYGIRQGSDVYRAAGELLTLENGRYRVRLEGDAIRGHEFFWNAHGGKRGSIVIIVPRRQFDAEAIFRGGYEAYACFNMRAAHTPAAVRFARERADSTDAIAFCLPRNNGIEWMDVFVHRKHVLKLFKIAKQASGKPR